MAATAYMEFEKPIAELEKKIEELRGMTSGGMDFPESWQLLKRRWRPSGSRYSITSPAGRRRRWPAT